LRTICPKVCFGVRKSNFPMVLIQLIDTLKAITSREVTDEMLDNAKYRFPVNTPRNREEYYRSLFNEHFTSETAALCVPSVPGGLQYRRSVGLG
jgi:hypothetical protein